MHVHTAHLVLIKKCVNYGVCMLFVSVHFYTSGLRVEKNHLKEVRKEHTVVVCANLCVHAQIRESCMPS